ncbi:MAG: ATP synthase subunit I [Planctomycetes bacterium]|nr:ATP synthase subunit I [Planctomycetota bacterium]
MNEFLQYQRTILVICLIGCGVAIAATYAICPGTPAYAYGMALGSIAGLIKFRLDVLAIIRFARNVEENKARGAVKTALHTYLLMIGALLVALLMQDTINPWTTFAGIMIPRAILTADGILRPSTTHVPDAAVETNGGDSE